jgi:uncharacterized membrane protein
VDLQALIGVLVSARPRWLVIASLAVVVLLVAGVAFTLLGVADPAGYVARLASAAWHKNEGADTGAVSLVDARTETSEGTKKAIKDKPAPPKPPAPGTAGDAAWQLYIDQTRQIVVDHQTDLDEAVAAISQALSTDDGDAIDELLAPDEDSAGFGDQLVGQYPAISSATPSQNVNVYTNGSATLYFAYCVVQWSDGGLASEHTIPIVLRFVDGAWHVTTLGDDEPDLQFVQTVML